MAPFHLTLMLAMLVSVAPFAIDMYLPAMQIMAVDLQTPIHQIELSVSAFLLGFAVGQLTGGALSDRLGRKPIVALGLIIFIIASVALTFIESVDALLAVRGLQALGGGLAIVNSSAMVRDLFSGSEVARVLSTVALVMMVAPLVAPMIGTLIVTTLGWRAIFAVLAAYALFVLFVFMVKVPESRRIDSGDEKVGVFEAYWQIISHRKAMGYVMASAFTMGCLFTFITASPFVYLEHFGLSPSNFPFVFGVNVVLIMILNRVNIRLLSYFTPHRILLGGMTLQLLSGFSLLAAAYLNAPLPVIVLFCMLILGSLGLIGANSAASCLNYFPKISGSANAAIGVSGFMTGGLAGFVWAALHDSTLMPMAQVILGCSLTGFLGLLVLSGFSDDSQDSDQEAEREKKKPRKAS